MEKISTCEEGSDMKLTEVHGGGFLYFELILNIIGKRGAGYVACIGGMRHGVECRMEYLEEETVWKV